MKSDDQKLKDLFRMTLEPLKESSPNFDEMWRATESERSKTIRSVWKIAAIVALLITAGTVVILIQNRPMTDTAAIVSWDAPTKGLMTGSSYAEMTAVSAWTSPTGFLLETNTQDFK